MSSVSSSTSLPSTSSAWVTPPSLETLNVTVPALAVASEGSSLYSVSEMSTELLAAPPPPAAAVEVELDSVVVAALVLELVSPPPPQAETLSGIATARAIRDLCSTDGLLVTFGGSPLTYANRLPRDCLQSGQPRRPYLQGWRCGQLRTRR